MKKQSALKKLVLAKQTIRELAQHAPDLLADVRGALRPVDSLGCWYTAGSHQGACCG